MIGEVVRDRYELVAVLGRGGQGQVLRAFDHQHERAVALKVRLVRSEDERRILLREARTLLTLRPHPGLPLVREDFFVEDRYYIVMEWVDGTTLADLRREAGGRLPLGDVEAAVGQAADALDHLHAHRPPIVHRDVKPGNLIRTPDGRMVLVDFGLSSPSGEPLHPFGGTSGYAAPELATGGAVEPAADVFGLAATTFALLVGRSPDGLLPDWSFLPDGAAERVERAIRRGLSIDPSRRQSSAGAFVEDLTGPRRGGVEARAAVTESSLRAAGPRRRRMRATVVLAAMALLVTVVGVRTLGRSGAERAAAGPHADDVAVVVGTLPDDDVIDPGARDGLARVRSLLDVQGTVHRETYPDAYQGALERFAAEGYGIVIGLTDVIETDTAALAEYPDTTFYLLEQEFPLQDNVVEISFRAEEAGYLAGYLAGLMVQREDGDPVVSSVAGLWAVPEIQSYVAGFEAGASAAVPGISILRDETGAFGDPGPCRRAARRQIERGSQVVFVVAGPCGLGAIEAASEAGVWAVRTVVDRPGPWILTTARKDFASAVYAIVEQARSGELRGGRHASLGVAEGAVELGTVHPDVPAEVLTIMRGVVEDLRTGRVADIPTTLPEDAAA